MEGVLSMTSGPHDRLKVEPHPAGRRSCQKLPAAVNKATQVSYPDMRPHHCDLCQKWVDSVCEN